MRKTKCSNCGNEVWYPEKVEEIPFGLKTTYKSDNNGVMHFFCHHRCGREAITKGIITGIDAYPLNPQKEDSRHA